MEKITNQTANQITNQITNQTADQTADQITDQITDERVHIGRIEERILRNQKRIIKLQELLKNEKIRELEITQKLAENDRWVNSTTENQNLLAKCRTNITKIEFKLNGITEKKNRKTGQIVVEKVGELHLSEFLAIELGKMKERLAVLLKKNESQNC